MVVLWSDWPGRLYFVLRLVYSFVLNASSRGFIGSSLCLHTTEDHFVCAAQGFSFVRRVVG